MSGRLEVCDRQVKKDGVRFGISGHTVCSCQIIVCYMGTIAMPRNTRAWERRTQSVHNAVKRLTDLRTMHTRVRLNLNSDGIQLFSPSGRVLMHHSRDGVASFGLCPGDDMLFCLVTFDNLHSSDEDSGAGPNCHIFRVDPGLVSHKDHLEIAKDFGMQCEFSVDKDYCVEFPTSAHSAVELFQRFYAEMLTVFNYSTESLDMAMFIPLGFENRFNINGIRNDSDCNAKHGKVSSSSTCVVEMNFRSKGPDTHAKKSVLDLSVIKPHKKFESSPSVLERTATFPAVVSLEEFNDTLKCNQSSDGEHSGLSANSLDVGMLGDWYQELGDSPNGAESLREQVKKFLHHRSEPSPVHLHVRKFSASETLPLGPESPLPSLPVRLKPGAGTNHESRLACKPTLSLKVTQSLVPKSSILSQSLAVNQVPAKQTVQAERLPLKSRVPCSGAKQLDAGNETRDSCLYCSSAINMCSTPTQVESENQAFDEVLGLIDKPRRVINLAKLHVFPSSPQWNLSFHGSLESVCSDDSYRSEQTTKFFGSCRGLAPNFPEVVGRAASWAVAFDNLLNDSAGVTIFLQHLKNEFSQENLNFWLKCEEYKKLPEKQRKIEAEKIYRNHLDLVGCESVNVEQAIIFEVEKSLQLAPVDLFDEAQKHIYKLMKEDSYSRFKTSKLYKDAVVTEMEGRPFSCELKCSGVTSKEKDAENIKLRSKDNKSTDDKRRLSLSFWQKKKSAKKAKLSSSQELLKNNQTTKVKENERSDPSAVSIRVTLPDGSVTNVNGSWGQKIIQVLLQLDDKLKSGLNFVEAVDPTTQMVLDVMKDIKTLSCEEIHLKDCVLFRLTLPDETSLAVRVPCGKTVTKVFGPILKKYGLTFEKVVMHIAGTGIFLKEKMVVNSLDCCHVLVESLIASKGKRKGLKAGIIRQVTSSSLPNSRLHASRSEVQARLEKVFRDVFDGEVDFSAVPFDEVGTLNLKKLARLNGRRSNSRFSLFTPRASIDKTRPLADLNKKPPAFKTEAPDDDFFNLLMSSQSRRLDSQRGVLRKEDLQLPDFLKEDTETYTQPLDITSIPSLCVSLNNSVESASKDSWPPDVRITSSLTSMEESSPSSSESVSTDHDWKIENDPVSGTFDHRPTSHVIRGLSRTALQANGFAKKRISPNIDVCIKNCDGANKSFMQRTVESNFSPEVAANNGIFKSSATASAIREGNGSFAKSFHSSYV